MRKYNVVSDLVLVKSIEPVVYKQYDNGDTLEVELYQDNEKIELTNEDVLAFFQLEDENKTVIQKTCAISNGNAIATLDNNILSVGGKVKVEFTIYENGKETTTRTLLITVEASINRNKAIETVPQWDIVSQIITDGPSIIADVKQAAENALAAAEIALNAVGPEGPQGEKGDTGEQGPIGLTGEKGEMGDTGSKGDTGAGLTILGSFESEEELPETGELGNGYLIGGNLYVWGGTTWQNVGNIKGPKGEQGEQGEQGEKGETGAQGERGDKGDSFTVNATGLLADRDAYDSKPSGFSFLATDTASLYIRQGDEGWSEPIPFGKGEQGEKGNTGERGEKGEKGDVGEQGIQGLTGEKGDPGTTSWIGMEDKPEEFPPSGHAHPIAEIEGLQAIIESTGGTINGLSTAIDNHGKIFGNYGLGGTAADWNSKDLNNLSGSGLFMGSNMVNAPTAGWWFIDHLDYDVVAGTYAMQIAYGFSTGTVDTMVYRNKQSNIWGPWKPFGGGGGGREKFFSMDMHENDTGIPQLYSLDINTSKHKNVIVKFRDVSRHPNAADVTSYVVSLRLGTTGGATQHVKRANNATAYSVGDASGAQINVFTVKARPAGYSAIKWHGEIEIDTLSYRYNSRSQFYNTDAYRMTPPPDGLIVENITELFFGRTVTSEKYEQINGKNYGRVKPLENVTFIFGPGTGGGIQKGTIEAWGIPHGL